MTNQISILYTTIGGSKQAEDLANLAIANGLAVCVNILSNGKSIYLWNSKIDQSEEYYMIFKTTIDLIDKLEDIITKNHPYDVPVILKWQCEANEEFMKYIKECTHTKNRLTKRKDIYFR